eukprot:scaffold277183_cov14-Tisochrysis_lutea.AAC.1
MAWQVARALEVHALQDGAFSLATLQMAWALGVHALQEDAFRGGKGQGVASRHSFVVNFWD